VESPRRALLQHIPPSRAERHPPGRGVARFAPFACAAALLLTTCSQWGYNTAGPAAPSPPAPTTVSAPRARPPQRQPAAAPTPPTVAAPARLIIPAIGVNASVEHVGTTPSGAMEAPRRWADVAWFQPGYAPGVPGNAVIAGHLDSTTASAVFWNLHRLVPGNRVVVQRTSGAEVNFVVTGSSAYRFDRVPLAVLFGPSSVPHLNLITCDGVFDRGTENYSERLVVYTKEVAT